MRTVLLLIGSNVFMTLAWYLHLRPEYQKWPMWQIIGFSWAIAFFEYCLQVPANRIGYNIEGYSGAQLKIVQEVITLVVFCIFSVLVLKEPLKWRYLAAFALVLGAVAIVATGKEPAKHAAEEPAASPDAAVERE
jgi:uncharacterized protein (DUF486 family)